MLGDIYQELKTRLEAEKLTVLATVVDGPGRGRQMLIGPRGRILGSLKEQTLDVAALEGAVGVFRSFASRRLLRETGAGEADIFLEIHPPRPQLIIVGAVHVAISLIHFARHLGFRTIVVDPRTAFATPERFAHADELLTEWPQAVLPRLVLHANTYLALLSHDLKLDLPALEVTLRRPVRYIGALGSKKTHGKRLAALAEMGFSEEEVGRIHNPIGLDLGGRRAEEIAVAVIAEMIAVRHGIGFKPATAGPS